MKPVLATFTIVGPIIWCDNPQVRMWKILYINNMTSITWAGPRCVQEPAAILAPQNRTQGRCDMDLISSMLS